MRETTIRIKLQEIVEGVSLVQDALPENAEEFHNIGLIKDGIYKRIEFAIENVFLYLCNPQCRSRTWCTG